MRKKISESLREKCNQVKEKTKNIYWWGRVKTSREQLVRKREKHSSERYTDLAPKDNAEKTSEYFEALDWALNNPDVYNIALTGPYGSGKSSIIKSYLRKRPELNYLNISLANFYEAEGDGQRSLIEVSDDKLEIGILKQLFYKVEAKKIPQSRYRKLHTISKRKIFRNLLLLSVMLVGCFAFFVTDLKGKLMPLIENAKTNVNMPEGALYGVGAILIGLLLFLVTYLVWGIVSSVRIKEVNIAQKVKTTVNNAEDNSIFDKNMDEIVYFFEATGYNIVFIEDLDRFENASIFVKLRELNTILNNYEKIKKRIVFIYAVKDDIFSREDRTKFFEFMLPVIPYINATNSGEILYKMINECDSSLVNNELSMEYINLVSSYIDDMRVLRNIYNEFMVYKKVLKGGQDLKLSDRIMFSMMIYKNVHPKDFAELQAEGGLVKEAFKAKKDIIIRKRQEVEQRRQEVIALLNSAEQDMLDDLKEVKAAMLFYMTKFQGQFTHCYAESKKIEFCTIYDDDFDIEDLWSDGIVTVHYYPNIYGGREDCSFNPKTEFVGSRDYIKRCKEIVAKLPEEKAKYQKELELLDEEKHKISALKLKDLLEDSEMEEVLPEQVSSNELLVFMLRNGFIDETYSSYMNYFHANSITKEDMNFILSVRNHKAEEFSYPLSCTEQIVKRLVLAEFDQKEIYNFDLLDQLVSSEESEEYCMRVIKQLSDEDEISWQFINQYVDKALDPERFLELLCHAWDGMWDYIYSNNLVSKDRKDKYLNKICLCATIEDVKKMNANGNITQYFEETPDILKRLVDLPAERIKEVIDACDVVFTKLNVDKVNREVLEWIYEGGRYQNTLAMIESYFAYKQMGGDVQACLTVSNYTALLECGTQSLLEYIYESFNQYIEEVVLAIPTNTKESLEAVLDMIERGIEIDNIVRLIGKEDVRLDDLRRCSFEYLETDQSALEQVWNAWVENDKLKPTWENVHLYSSTHGLSSSLVSFIERNIDELIMDEATERIEENFIHDVLVSKMKTFCFEKVIKKFGGIKVSWPVEQVNKEYLKSLIEHRYFEYSVALIVDIGELNPELSSQVIIKYIKPIIEDIKDYQFEVGEIEDIINSNEVDDADKILFITNCNIEEYSENVALYLRSRTEELTINVFNRAWEALAEQDRYELLLNQISILDNEQISDCFEELGAEYQRLSMNHGGRDVTLYDTTYNRKLAKKLKSVSYITSFDEQRKKKNTVEKFLTLRKKRNV